MQSVWCDLSNWKLITFSAGSFGKTDGSNMLNNLPKHFRLSGISMRVNSLLVIDVFCMYLCPADHLLAECALWCASSAARRLRVWKQPHWSCRWCSQSSSSASRSALAERECGVSQSHSAAETPNNKSRKTQITQINNSRRCKSDGLSSLIF